MSEKKFTTNIRKKIDRSAKDKWGGTCYCGGLSRYELKRCFRPGGAACKRRAIRIGLYRPY